MYRAALLSEDDEGVIESFIASEIDLFEGRDAVGNGGNRDVLTIEEGRIETLLREEVQAEPRRTNREN